MRTNPSSGSKKLLLILILLLGGISASALTFPFTFLPASIAGEGSFFASFTDQVPISNQPIRIDATVSTDKGDYKPGEIVQISGSGFLANETVTLQVIHVETSTLKSSSFASLTEYDHAGHEPWQVTAGADGTITSSWLVQEDSLNKTLKLTADGQSSGLHAETLFTDSSIGTYDQCSNDDGDGYTTGDLGCRWINGNLNKNNSTYAESEATVQRLWLIQFEPGAEDQTITLQYGTTKSGTHAYDYLTTWNHSENWITTADLCQDIIGCVSAFAAASEFDIPQDPNVPDSFEPSDPGDRQFVMAGGTITAVSEPDLVSGQYGSGDTETAITITFNVADSGSMCTTDNKGITTCAVAIWFGAHIADENDWIPIDGFGGAASVSGSPYHVSLDKLNGASIGERDNQMQSDTVIQRGAIRVVKNTVGGDGSFAFTSNFGLPSPITTTGGTGSEEVTGLVAGNGYSVSEIVPAGWSLTSFSCVLEGGGATGMNGTTGVTGIVVETGKTTTCTFNNSKPDMFITITPATETNEVGQQHVFDVTVTQIPNGATPATTVDVTPTVNPAPSSQSSTCTSGLTFTNNVASCTITINSTSVNVFTANASATAVVGGVTLTRATNGNSGPGGSGPATKTYVDMSIAITPNTETNAVGDPHVFTVTVTKYPASASGGTVNISTALNPVPGTLGTNTCGANVAFNVNGVASCTVEINSNVAGTFTLNASATATIGGISITRDTDPATASISAGPGGSGPATKNYVDMSVAITPGTDTNPVNEQHVFTITVRKYPGTASGTTVAITPSISPQPPTLTVVGTTCSGTVAFNNDTATCTYTINSSAPGVFTVNATAVATIGGVLLTRDTDPSSAPVSGPNGSGPATKTYEAGVIIVDKVTYPAGDLQAFTFAPNWTTSFQLADATPPHNSGSLAPGTYSVSESVPPGWDLTSATCGSDQAGDMSTPGAISLQAGETVTCTFRNTKRGTIIVEKQTDPDRASGSFTFTGTAAGTISDNGQIVVSNLQPATYTSTESDPGPGFDLTSIVCDDGTSSGVSSGSLVTRTATFRLDPGETVKCVFTNTQRGRVDLTKTFQGGALTDPNVSFQFQIRQNASETPGTGQGTILSEEFANSDNGGNVDFATLNTSNKNGILEAGEVELLLVPGDYQICEYIEVGWDSTIRDILGAFVPEGAGDPQSIDNSFVCAPFTITPGETEAITIDNMPPPGGMAKTIGFWKNHASCKASNGKQDPVLDEVLATFPIALGQTRPGVYIGNYYVDTCLEAVALLDKRTYSTTKKGGDKAASDPAYNMAAQLMAAKLNLQAGANDPTCLGAIIDEADDLLALVNFNGLTIPSYGSGAIAAARKARMNYLAGLLDAYNNNELNCNDYIPLP